MPQYLGTDEQGNAIIQPDDPGREPFAMSEAELQLLGGDFNQPDPGMDPMALLGGDGAMPGAATPMAYSDEAELASILGLPAPGLDMPAPDAPAPGALPPPIPDPSQEMTFTPEEVVAAAPQPLITPPSYGLGGDIDRAAAQAYGLAEGSARAGGAGYGDAIAATDAVDSAMAEYESVLPELQAAEEERAREQFQIYEDARKRINEIDTHIADLVAKEPDPGRWWASRGDWQKVAAYIAVIGEGILNPGGQNAALANILDRIDRDVASQEATIERQLRGAQIQRQGVFDELEFQAQKAEAKYALVTARATSITRVLDVKIRRAKNAQERAGYIAARAQLGQVVAGFAQHQVDVAAGYRDAQAQRRFQARMTRAAQQTPQIPYVTDPRTGLPMQMTVAGPDGKEVQVPVTARNEKAAIEASEMLGHYKMYRAKLTELIGLTKKAERMDLMFERVFGGFDTDRAKQLQHDLGRAWLLASGDERFSDADQAIATGKIILGPRILKKQPTEALEALREVASREMKTKIASKGVYVGPGGVNPIDLITADEDPVMFGATDDPPDDGIELTKPVDTSGLSPEEAVEKIKRERAESGRPTLSEGQQADILRLATDEARFIELYDSPSRTPDEDAEMARLFDTNKSLRNHLSDAIGQERLDESLKATGVIPTARDRKARKEIRKAKGAPMPVSGAGIGLPSSVSLDDLSWDKMFD